MRARRVDKLPASGVRTGTLTVLLLVSAIVLAVTSVLALQTARMGAAQTDAFAANIEQFYLNDTQAHELLATVDAALSGETLGAEELAAKLPAECEVDGSAVIAAFQSGTMVPPGSINLMNSAYDGGLTASGISQADVQSTPALLVEISTEDGIATVRSWKHVRSYDSGQATGSIPLFTGELP